MASEAYPSSSPLELCLKSNSHNTNTCLTRRLRYLLHSEKIKRSIDAIVPMQVSFSYFKISVIKDTSVLRASQR